MPFTCHVNYKHFAVCRKYENPNHIDPFSIQTCPFYGYHVMIATTILWFQQLYHSYPNTIMSREIILFSVDSKYHFTFQGHHFTIPEYHFSFQGHHFTFKGYQIFNSVISKYLIRDIKLFIPEYQIIIFRLSNIFLRLSPCGVAHRFFLLRRRRST